MTNAEYLVKRWFFDSTDTTAYYEVWEPASGPAGDHSTITTFEDASAEKGYRWWGRVTTKGLRGTGYDAIPGPSDARSAAFRAYHASRCVLAYSVIRLAFPGLTGIEDDGEIREPGVLRTNGDRITTRRIVITDSPHM